MAVNPFAIKQNTGFYNQTDILLFLSSVGTKFIQSRDRIAFIHRALQSKFARDCSFSVYEGATVTFVAMQLAFYREE